MLFGTGGPAVLEICRRLENGSLELASCAQIATLGTGSRGPKGIVRLLLSWCLGLADSWFSRPAEAWKREFGASFLSAQQATLSTGSRGPQKPCPALTAMVFGTGTPARPQLCRKPEFGASFFSIQKATLGTGSRGSKDPVRPSLSWCLELAGPRFGELPEA